MSGQPIALIVAVTLTAPLAAQVPTTVPRPTATAQPPISSDRASDTFVTGCLARGTDGIYMLTNARIDPAPADSTIATTGTASTRPAPTGTAGTSGTAPTEPAGSGTARSASTWVLSGGADLDKHIGHRIQVSGREVKAPEAAESAAAVPTHPAQKLDVQAVKMIASSCS